LLTYQGCVFILTLPMEGKKPYFINTT
jgi:hypothetical protein